MLKTMKAIMIKRMIDAIDFIMSPSLQSSRYLLVDMIIRMRVWMMIIRTTMIKRVINDKEN